MDSSQYRAVHPVLIIGIIIFILPFMGQIIKWNIPSWTMVVGIIVILLGAGLSIMKSV